MGDIPKPPDDAAWTEVEQSFFAAAPPEAPQPIEEAPCFDDLAAPSPRRPRREIVRRAWRGAAVIAGAAGATVRRTARAGAASLIAALSIGRVDRRRAVFVLVGAIMAAGLTAGGVAVRKGVLTKGITAEREGPVRGPTVAEPPPVAIAASQPAPRPNVRSSADIQAPRAHPAPRADVSNRRPHSQRRPVPVSSSAQGPQVTAFMDRETYWAREARPAPGRSSGPAFSR